MDSSLPKIVQLSSVHTLYDTRIFYKICRSLVDAGYDLDLLVQNPRDEVIDGISVIGLPVAEKKWDRFLKTIPALFKKAIQYPQNTIFHFHDPELIPIGLFLKSCGYRVIYDVHEDVPATILDKEWVYKPIRNLLSKIADYLEKLANSMLDATVVVTKSIKNRFDESTYLIQNFPKLSELEMGAQPADKLESTQVFYVGRISKLRCIFEMVEAIEKANTERDIRLLLAGTFDDNELRVSVENKKGWKFTEYKGRVNREELSNYAQKSLAGLVIFKPVANHRNAQPNKLFEYMAQGLPIIGSDFPLWREIVTKNNCGILIDPENAEEISEAILWLESHPEEAEIMGENGKKMILKKYNWSIEEKKLLSVYNSFQSTSA